MEHKQTEPLVLKGFQTVTVTKTAHIVEVQHMKKKNTMQTILKLDQNTYVDLSTGEIKEFNKTDNRQQNYNSLRKTFKKMRYLINNNFYGQPNELHITLTYKENMTDTKRLYSDFDKFMKKMKYKYKSLTSLDYLSVVEPQQRGAWHYHVLMRFNELDKVYIKSSELQAIWGQGFVKIKSLKDIDNIGAYLSAYLTDLEFTVDKIDVAVREHLKIVEKDVEGQSKAIIKGGRLHMYPTGLNIFRKSKGIVYPDREEMLFSDIKKIVGSAKPHYQKKYVIENDDFQNEITFLQYNLKKTT